VDPAPSKLKKADGPPALSWTTNPDILAELGASSQRPRLLVGFAAETGDALGGGEAKLASKGCDWIVANDVSDGILGGDSNAVHLITAAGSESWAMASKQQIAHRLAEKIADALA
jgi:phosphopantothenoylcysteine decarboxylase/phosphopantothenate--cysteine ligase